MTPDYDLVLYVAGGTPRSAEAVLHVRALCDARLRGRHALEVVDVRLAPARALADGVTVAPTLLVRAPGPPRRITSGLGDETRLARALALDEEARAT